jgi:hypothetical protein
MRIVHRWRTLERAKGTLGVAVTKAGFAGGWAWKLPEVKTGNLNEDRANMIKFGGIRADADGISLIGLLLSKTAKTHFIGSLRSRHLAGRPPCR